jgi:hypothetical protein
MDVIDGSRPLATIAITKVAVARPHRDQDDVLARFAITRTTFALAAGSSSRGAEGARRGSQPPPLRWTSRPASASLLDLRRCAYRFRWSHQSSYSNARRS